MTREQRDLAEAQGEFQRYEMLVAMAEERIANAVYRPTEAAEAEHKLPHYRLQLEQARTALAELTS